MLKNKETNKYTEIPHKLPTYFLTLKAHKTPQSVRGVASVSGTIIAALARLLSSAQQLCITNDSGSSGPRVIVTDLASLAYTSCTVSCSSQVRNTLF
jgi:hypothetical protein